jgi:uncharacterized protein YggL (DUF469 family)
LDIFGGFPRWSRVTDPANLVFEGSQEGVLRVEVFCDLVLFLALDNNGRALAKLWLRRQGILGDRLQEFYREDGVYLHGR